MCLREKILPYNKVLREQYDQMWTVTNNPEDTLEAENWLCVYDNINALPLFLTDCHTEGQNILFTDGEYINQIAASRDVSATYDRKPIFLSTELFYFTIFIASFSLNVWRFLH